MLEVLVITGRSMKQGIGKEVGKGSKRYFDAVSRCEMNPDDMGALGIGEGGHVSVTTDHGRVVLKAYPEPRVPRGRIFIPYGPYASMIVGDETYGSGMPALKNLKARIEPTAEEVLGPIDLVRRRFSR